MQRALTGFRFLALAAFAFSTGLGACSSTTNAPPGGGTGGAGGCPPGFLLCGGACVEVTANSLNCGTCNNVCPAGASCVAGQCTCAPSTADCGTGVCIDTTSNATNCGACGVVCTVPIETCMNSACTCTAGYSACPTGCVNTQTDPANCGACGVTCVAPQVCSLGACSDTCAAGLEQCTPGSCVNVQTDVANCGACGVTCGSGQTCVAGACQCSSGLTACGATCVDTLTDITNCGACGNACGAGQVCSAGTCTCTTAGQTACGGVCVDTLTDPANCGACGTICTSGVCQAGACQGATGTGGTTGTGGAGATAGTGATTGTGATAGTGGSTADCDPGLTDCWGLCVDPQNNPEHCGECGIVCPTGECNAGVCPTVKDCYVKTQITSPIFTDFEDYDGTEPVNEWGFAFNAAAGEEGAVYAGPFEYNDGTGTPTLSMGTGYDSVYAANVANPNASEWGGALGFWMGCIDATLLEGISFWIQGYSPTGTVNMTVAMAQTSEPAEDDPVGGGTCESDCAAANYDIPITSTWTLLQIPWASFTPGTANGADVPVTGDNITGLTFNVPLVFEDDGTGEWVGVPSDYTLSIDDIQFIGAGACPTGQILCGVGCTDTNTDPDHCGSCGNACTAERACVAGQCVCPDGYVECEGECVNLDIDVQHCGACNAQCSGVCSGGSCQASTCTAGMPHVNETCNQSDQIFLGKYWLNNNVWGADNGASGSQCIWQTCESGNTIGWGTSWSWSGDGSVLSYASSVLGWHWGWEEQNGNVDSSGLPVQLSSGRNVTCGWTFDVTNNGTINVSYDLWAHNSSNPDYSTDPNHEIMVWLYSAGGAGPIGSRVADVVVDGTTWGLYEGNNGHWPVHSFVRSSNTTSTTLNLMGFLDALVSRGSMSSSQYLTSIEAGTEVYNGSGELNTSSYYCTIQ